MTQSARTRVMVLYGGRSAEHEISLISARFIVASLDRSRFEPVLVGITKAGRWRLQQPEALLAGPADARVVALPESGPEVVLPAAPDTPDGQGGAELRVDDGRRIRVEVAFPVLHGPMGEDGCMQGLFELALLPYVGAGVLGSAIGMDKAQQRSVLAHAELPVLPMRVLRTADWRERRDDAVRRCEELPYPLFVKPANMGSSLGIRRARSRDELCAAVSHALELDVKVVVEPGLDRPREIELAVLGNAEPLVSLPGEIAVRHRDGFYSYDAKYLDDGAELLIPARLDELQRSAAQLLALRTYRTLDLEGMARVDLFLTQDGELLVNEVNTIPGFTAISMYPRLWAASGVDAKALVSRLVDLAVERHRERAALRTTRA